MNYIQCKILDGDIAQVAWLPKKFAVVGKYLKISDTDGWLVVEVYSDIELPYELVNANSRDYLATRKASDI
jgi:hypothetical protein